MKRIANTEERYFVEHYETDILPKLKRRFSVKDKVGGELVTQEIELFTDAEDI